jgi:hypothetical protein
VERSAESISKNRVNNNILFVLFSGSTDLQSVIAVLRYSTATDLRFKRHVFMNFTIWWGAGASLPRMFFEVWKSFALPDREKERHLEDYVLQNLPNREMPEGTIMC